MHTKVSVDFTASFFKVALQDSTHTRLLREEAAYRHNHIASSSIVWSTAQRTAVWLHISHNCMCFRKKRLITKSAMSMFTEMLKNESWDNIINHTVVNGSFNLFLITFIIIFESCFPMQYATNS